MSADAKAATGDTSPIVQSVPSDWRTTLDMFRSRGLTNRDLMDAARITERVQPDNKWRYFCGICWTKLDDRTRLSSILREVQ